MNSPSGESAAHQLARQRHAALQTANSLLVLQRRERKAIDDRLHDIEDRFRQLAEQSGEGFWFVELAPPRIAYVNPAIERLFGVPAQRFYDDPQVWLAAIHPDDRARVLGGWETFVASQTARFREEYRVVSPDGAVRWVVASGTPTRDEAGAATRMSGILEDITERRRLEAERADAERRTSLALEAGQMGTFELDLDADTTSALAPKAHEKDLTLIVDVGESVPHTLCGDPARLRQILVNLLGNAVKFTRVGEIALRMRSEPVTSREVMLHVSVSDTGVGIPWDRQQSVFAAFTQVDGSSTRSHGGTGLGLTLSLQLAQLMGGRLWVESEAGRGSTFHLTVRCGVVERRR